MTAGLQTAVQIYEAYWILVKVRMIRGFTTAFIRFWFHPRFYSPWLVKIRVRLYLFYFSPLTWGVAISYRLLTINWNVRSCGVSLLLLYIHDLSIGKPTIFLVLHGQILSAHQLENISEALKDKHLCGKSMATLDYD